MSLRLVFWILGYLLGVTWLTIEMKLIKPYVTFFNLNHWLQSATLKERDLLLTIFLIFQTDQEYKNTIA